MKLENNGKTSSTKNTRHMEIRYFFIKDNIWRNELSVKYCPTDIILGDYYTKPQQGIRMRRSRVAILNLKYDPTQVSQECVKTCTPNQLGELTTRGAGSNNYYKCYDVYKNDTSLSKDLVRRKATSYMMATKGLLTKVNDKVNRLDSLYSINLTQ